MILGSHDSIHLFLLLAGSIASIFEQRWTLGATIFFFLEISWSPFFYIISLSVHYMVLIITHRMESRKHIVWIHFGITADLLGLSNAHCCPCWAEKKKALIFSEPFRVMTVVNHCLSNTLVTNQYIIYYHFKLSIHLLPFITVLFITFILLPFITIYYEPPKW